MKKSSLIRAAQLDYDIDLVKKKSKHYVAYIAANKCLVEMLKGRKTRGRLTVHHAIKEAYGRRGPDFLAVPLSESLHVSGPSAVHKIGVDEFLDRHALPSWELLCLLYLTAYIEGEVHTKRFLDSRNGFIKGDQSDRDSAIHYARDMALELNYI